IMHKNSQKPCYERVAQDAMQMILIMRVKKLYKPTQHKSYPFSMYCSHAFGGEQRFIEEVCCYEKFESQPGLANFAGYGAGHSVGQLSALSQ
ncbi:TPA: hypothetical protein ACIT9B_003964, partial [Salmonella enterica subsp. enterica serovar Saintpaul]